MAPKHNVVGWFEIPVTNMERAIKFYETVFGFTLTRWPMEPMEMVMFPGVPDAIGAAGSLVYYPEYYKPSTEGVKIFFSTQAEDLSVELSRVEAAGGKVVMPKTLITEEIGYWGQFIDTEGNCIALHSLK
jgi:predicted enzyme related to lactoylglutathione lyase